MMCILYMMVGVSTFTFCHMMYAFVFYSDDCNPVYLPREIASAFNFVDLFVTRQLWIYVVSQFFWPTKSHIEDNEIYDEEKKHLVEEENKQKKKKAKLLLLAPNRSESDLDDEKRRQSTGEDTSVAFLGVQQSTVFSEED